MEAKENIGEAETETLADKREQLREYSRDLFQAAGTCQELEAKLDRIKKGIFEQTKKVDELLDRNGGHGKT